MSLAEQVFNQVKDRLAKVGYKEQSECSGTSSTRYGLAYVICQDNAETDVEATIEGMVKTFVATFQEHKTINAIHWDPLNKLTAEQLSQACPKDAIARSEGGSMSVRVFH